MTSKIVDASIQNRRITHRRLLITLAIIGSGFFACWISMLVYRFATVPEVDVNSIRRFLDSFLRIMQAKHVRQATAFFALEMIPGDQLELERDLEDYVRGSSYITLEGYTSLTLDRVLASPIVNIVKPWESTRNIVQVSASMNNAKGHTNALEATLIGDSMNWKMISFTISPNPTSPAP